MKVIIIFGIAALMTGCSEATFSFRGYTEKSTCDELVKAEEAIGSVYTEDSTEEWEQQLNFQSHRMKGEYSSFPVYIEVTCYKETVSDVNYVYEDLSESKARDFESELVSQWSQSFDVPAFDEHRRSSDYRDAKGVLRGNIPYKRVSLWCGDKTMMSIVTYLPENHGDPYSVSFALGFLEKERATVGC